MISSRLTIWFLVAGAVAVACGPRAHSTEANTPAAVQTAAKSSKAGSKAAKADTMLKLASSFRAAVQGSTVAFSFHVTNASKSKLELTFPSGQRYDFMVVDSVGREVWRWSAERMFTQVFQTQMLEPNETLSFEERWDTGGLRGKFTAVATLSSNNQPVTERIELTLP